MKRIFLYIVMAAALLAIPLERTDVADLHPVQTVALYKTLDGYRIETDTADYGAGATVEEAYADLLASTPGVIYLDTAEFFLVDENAVQQIGRMRRYLKNDVRICAVAGQGNLKTAGRFLSVQTGLQPLCKWEKGQKLPVLDCSTDRVKFL